MTVALNCQSIKKDPQKMSKIKPFIDQYNWKEINFPSQLSKTGKSLDQTINQFLLIFYMYLTILKKLRKEIDNGKTITHKIKFIDSFRFMLISLWDFVDNLSKGLYNNKYKDCKSCLKYILAIKEYLIFRCLECKKTRKNMSKKI